MEISAAGSRSDEVDKVAVSKPSFREPVCPSAVSRAEGTDRPSVSLEVFIHVHVSEAESSPSGDSLAVRTSPGSMGGSAGLDSSGGVSGRSSVPGASVVDGVSDMSDTPSPPGSLFRDHSGVVAGLGDSHLVEVPLSCGPRYSGSSLRVHDASGLNHGAVTDTSDVHPATGSVSGSEVLGYHSVSVGAECVGVFVVPDVSSTVVTPDLLTTDVAFEMVHVVELSGGFSLSFGGGALFGSGATARSFLLANESTFPIASDVVPFATSALV